MKKKRLQVLHVEDDKIDQMAFERIVQDEDLPYDCTASSSVAGGLAALQSRRFDVVVTDYYLGDGTCFELFEKLNGAPVIITTGVGDQEIAVKALRHGAYDYLIKDPERFYLKVLPITIEKALEFKRIKDDLQLVQVEHNIAAVFRSTRSGKLLDCNEAFANLLGYASRQEVLSVSSADFYFEPGVREKLFEKLEPAGFLRNHELVLRRKDGNPVYVLENVTLLNHFDEEEIIIGGSLIDITERRIAEERIREQAALLDKARDAICVRDLDDKIIYWNKSAERLYGWSAEEVIGEGGERFCIEDTSARRQEAEESLRKTGEWMGELHQVTRDGRSIVVESRCTMVNDSVGKPRSILVINTDVTEKKNLEAHFTRAQRMESLATLAGGVAHNLNNALAPITMAIQFLRRKTTDPQALETLTSLEQSAHHGAEVVKQFMAFSKVVEGEAAEFQVRFLLREIDDLIQETFPKSIKCEVETDSELSPVVGDATLLRQAILNLCVNARDAMPEGGRLKVMAENCVLRNEDAKEYPEARPGTYVRIRLEDSGEGIDADLIPRIFEPFFTTRELGKGTGLGLSAAYTIVKGMKGFIHVDSKPGRGTTVNVFLPSVCRERPVGLETDPRLPTGNGELVLFVDDEPAICLIAKSTLESFGYRVLAARNGSEALEQFKKHRDDIDVVVTDMMMPCMDGRATILALHALDSDVKIVATSGVIDADYVSEEIEKCIEGFLIKPFDAEALLKKLAKAIHANRSRVMAGS